MIQSYRDLIVWKKSVDLVKQVYAATDAFPAAEQYGLVSQMRRAAISIPSNIAEGFSRNYRKEFSQFASVAFGSGAELETQLFISKELDFIKDDDFAKIQSQLQEIMKMLNKLISSLKSKPIINTSR